MECLRSLCRTVQELRRIKKTVFTGGPVKLVLACWPGKLVFVMVGILLLAKPQNYIVRKLQS